MKNKIIAIALIGSIAGFTPASDAQDTMRQTTTTRSETVPAPVIKKTDTITESSHQHRSADGMKVEEHSASKTTTGQNLGTQTSSTTTTEETWTGTVKRVEPSRTVFVVNGTEYALSGPMMNEMTTHVDKEIRITGRMNAPTKTIQITRYESIR